MELLHRWPARCRACSVVWLVTRGGIRSAALLGMGLQRDAFIATATAVALVIDAVRLPVYVFTSHDQLLGMAPEILVATAGTMLGTVAGSRVLGRIPEQAFRRVVSGFVLLLGLAMLVRGF